MAGVSRLWRRVFAANLAQPGCAPLGAPSRESARRSLLAWRSESDSKDLHSDRGAGDQLGSRPGLTYLVATGLPTDSSAAISAADLRRPGLLPSAQRLSAPAEARSDEPEAVARFLARRAAADEQMRNAARSHNDS